MLRNSPSRACSAHGYDRSERCFLSCTSGTVQTEPAHCGVTSPGASAPNLVNTRMPKKLGRGPRARRVSRFSSNQKTSEPGFMAHTRLLPAARAQKRCHAGGEKYRNVGLTSLTCPPVFWIVFGVWTYFSLGNVCATFSARAIHHFQRTTFFSSHPGEKKRPTAFSLGRHVHLP